MIRTSYAADPVSRVHEVEEEKRDGVTVTSLRYEAQMKTQVVEALQWPGQVASAGGASQ